MYEAPVIICHWKSIIVLKSCGVIDDSFIKVNLEVFYMASIVVSQGQQFTSGFKIQKE